MTTGNPPTYEELYFYAKKELLKLGTANEVNPSEVFLLFNKAFNITREQLYSNMKSTVPLDNITSFYNLLNRRLNGEPLQYLLGEWEFFGLPFLVGPGVLIPRPETEELVEVVLTLLSGISNPKVLDLCSGTGCIPIAVTHLLPAAVAYGIELSIDAYHYFERNVALNNAHSVKAIQGDALTVKATDFSCKFDVITSNPPYISSGELANLQKEVQYEPAMALDGGYDGLSFYRSIAKNCKELLNKNGWLVFEIGNEQGNAVHDILQKNNYEEISIKKDLFGNERIAIGKLA